MNNFPSIIFPLPGNEQLTQGLIAGRDATVGEMTLRNFPDGETYVRVLCDVADKHVAVVCALHHPDSKLLPLYFLCRLLKDLHAASVTLVAPYLAYMRQDTQFNSGEAVTSQYMASLLSSFVDRLVTIDPHLHRRHTMSEIYNVPCNVIHASKAISDWIRANVPDAVVVGPDEESGERAAQVAQEAGVPYIVLEKVRHGDRDVEVSVPDVDQYRNYTPVLVDDIISTARTMMATVKHLVEAKMKPPVCIGVHAVFAGSAYWDLERSGAGRIITCNTIPHPSNWIDVSGLLAAGM